MIGKSAIVTILIFVSFISLASAGYSYANSAYWHCDIGGGWGWKTSDIQNCPSGYVNFFDSSQGCSASFGDVCLKYDSNTACGVDKGDECCYQRCRKTTCDDNSWTDTSSCSNTCGAGAKTQTSNCGNTRSISCTDYSSSAVYYYDADNDGYTNRSTTSSCGSPGTGWTTSFRLPGDCRDNNSSIRPNALEICNGADDNCNGLIDEGLNCGNNTNNNQTNQTNTTNVNGTVPIITIISPVVNGIYNGSVLLNASANQIISNWFYNLDNTGNYSFNLGRVINVSNGSHIILIYGNNSNGTGFGTVNFNINLGLGNQTNQTNTTINNQTNGTNITGNVPIIVILAPVNGSTYNYSLLNVNVSANQLIQNWSYVIVNNGLGGLPVAYFPNVALNFSQGQNIFIVWGTNQNGTGSANITFNVNFSANNSIVNNLTNTTTNQTNQTNDDETNDDEDVHDNSYEDLRNLNRNNGDLSRDNSTVLYLGNTTTDLQDFNDAGKFNLWDFVWLMFLVFLILSIFILIILIFKHL